MSSYLDIWSSITKRGKVYYKTEQLLEKYLLLEFITKRGKGCYKTGQLSGFQQDCFNETFSGIFRTKALKLHAIHNQKQSNIWSFITKRGKCYDKTGQNLRKDTYLQYAYCNQTFFITKRGKGYNKTGQNLRKDTYLQYAYCNQTFFITKRGRGYNKTGQLFESVRHLEFYHKTGQGL